MKSTTSINVIVGSVARSIRQLTISAVNVGLSLLIPVYGISKVLISLKMMESFPLISTLDSLILTIYQEFPVYVERWSDFSKSFIDVKSKEMEIASLHDQIKSLQDELRASELKREMELVKSQVVEGNLAAVREELKATHLEKGNGITALSIVVCAVLVAFAFSKYGGGPDSDVMLALKGIQGGVGILVDQLCSGGESSMTPEEAKTFSDGIINRPSR